MLKQTATDGTTYIAEFDGACTAPSKTYIMSHQIHSPKDVDDGPLRPGPRFATMQDLYKLKAEIMATVTEALAAFDTQMTAYNDAQDAAVTALQGDVKNLNDQIAALQNSPGQITASDQAILDKIQARGKTIADNLAALDALTPPVVPAGG